MALQIQRSCTPVGRYAGYSPVRWPPVVRAFDWLMPLTCVSDSPCQPDTMSSLSLKPLRPYLPPASCQPSHTAPADSYTTSAHSSSIPLGAHGALTCDTRGGVLQQVRSDCYCCGMTCLRRPSALSELRVAVSSSKQLLCWLYRLSRQHLFDMMYASWRSELQPFPLPQSLSITLHTLSRLLMTLQ